MDGAWKSWITPVLAVVLIGLLLVGGISWLLFSKAKQAHVAPEHLYSETGAIEAPVEKKVQANGTYAPFQGGQQPATQNAQTPVSAPSGTSAATPPPPPPPGGEGEMGGAPQQRPGNAVAANARPDSAVSARASTDTQNREARMRASMKKRIESTTPEDRARMAQLRIEERKYRQSHGSSGGGGGGRGPGGGGPPPP